MGAKLSEEREQRLEQLRVERLKLEELKEELQGQRKARLNRCSIHYPQQAFHITNKIIVSHKALGIFFDMVSWLLGWLGDRPLGRVFSGRCFEDEGSDDASWNMERCHDP